MKRHSILFWVTVVAMLISVGWLEGRDAFPKPGYADLFKVKRDPDAQYFVKLLRQNWGGDWNNYCQYTTEYNQLGLCTQMLESRWDGSEWRQERRNLFSYDAGNRLILTEVQHAVDNQWIAVWQDDWIYEDERLIQIITSQISSQGQSETICTVDLYYAADTGRLAQKIESFWEFNPGNSPMNRFDYSWDAQGRPIQIQKYQKNQLDAAWQVDLRDLFSYLPQDQSTYEQYLESILYCYTSNRLVEWPGYTSNLIDQNAIQYSPDEGASFDPYYLYDYIYSVDLVLNERRLFCTFIGMYELDHVMSYSLENDTLSVATRYTPNQVSGELMPDYRFMYSYSSSSQNADPETPAALADISAFPNPCRQFVNISFDLAKTAKTRLDVYNLRGQRVKTLLDASFAAGKHDIGWDMVDDKGRSLGSGIYLLKLSSNGLQHYLKMMVVK